MANEIECRTCGGDGWLVGDKADARGERTDDVRPCPDCNASEEVDTGLFERQDAQFIERMFDFGGES